MIIGFGDLAERLLPKLDGVAEVIGVSRNPQSLPETLKHSVYGDYTSLDSLAAAALHEPDIVIFTPVPASRDALGYQRGYAEAAFNIAGSGLLSSCRRAVYVSSTRVYAAHSGQWVTEDSPLAAEDPFVDALLAGEACFRRHATATILRPSGLYDGAKPIMLQPLLDGFASRFGDGYTNRVHRSDVAQLLADIVVREVEGRPLPATLNVNDDEPVKTKDLEAWCFERLGRAPEKLRDNRTRANRRISNHKLRSMGFQLAYPTFREGYEQVFG